MVCPCCELSVSSVRPAPCCPCPGPQLSAAVLCPQSAAARLAPSCPPASREARAGRLSVDRGPPSAGALSVRTAVRLRSCVRCVSVSAWSGVRRAARLYSRVRTHSRADTASGGRPAQLSAARLRLYGGCGHTLLCPQHSSAGLGTAALHCTALAQRHWCRHRLTAPHSTTLHGTTKHTALSVSVPAVPADTAVCQECRCADGSAAQEDDWGFFKALL